MSRSYTQGFSGRCQTKSDKWYRSKYHKNLRSKDNQNLRKCEKHLGDPEDLAFETFCNNKIDRSINFSDKWLWPSDGGTHWRADLETLRAEFNKEVLGEKHKYGIHTTLWEEYEFYREFQINKDPTTWTLIYDIFTEVVTKSEVCDRLPEFLPDKTESERFKFSSLGIYDCKVCRRVRKVWKRERVKVELDHHPLKEDLPKGAELVSIRKHKWYHNQAKRDGSLVEFLFHRNLIPLDFKNKEEMTDWLLTNQERLIRKWFRIRFKK